MNQTFALDNRLTVVLFAGMGGGCDGLEAAGFPVHIAINHDPVAVAVHQLRHPHTTHLRCDVFEADPRKVCKGRGVRILHASPDCTHFSVAKGGKPVSKRRRSLAWIVCRWAGTVRPETITLENVAEIQTWGPLIAKRDPATGRVIRLDGTVAAKGERVPVGEQWLVPDPRHRGRIWRAWLHHLAGLGYSFEGRVLVCADFGVPTIRKRFFGVAQADGSPIVWPERTHAPRHLARGLKLRPWVGAHTCIDWSIPMRSIFGRPKELADATKRRTARGVMRYVIGAKRPFIVPITHSGGDRRGHPTDEPFRTITTAHRGELALVAPHITKFRGGATGADMFDPMPTVTANSFEIRPGGAIPIGVAGAALAPLTAGAGGRAAQSEPRSLEDPAGSQATKEDRIVVAAHLVATGYGERAGQAPRALDIEEPAATQVAGGGKAALVAAFLQQHTAGSHAGAPARDPVDPISTLMTNGGQQGVAAVTLGRMRGADAHGQPIDSPMPTQTAGGGHEHLILAFLQRYYSEGGQDQDIVDPLTALTAKARHGLVTVDVRGVEMVMTDILIRMLEPEEGAAAHGFAPGSLPDQITIDGKTRRLTKTEKYHLVGNSVPPRMVRLLAECNGRRELVAEAAE
jgi:DNA (cytosine-5)-methyltransferase 1